MNGIATARVLALIDAVVEGADQPPTRGDVDRIVEIARGTRPATRHTLRIADVLNPARPARRQHGDAVLARAGAAFAAVRKHAGEAR